MSTVKKEVWIALGVALLMIAILGVVLLISRKDNTSSMSYKVYKLYTKEDNEKEHYYKECFTSTEDRINMHTDFKKIVSLPNSLALTGVSINGNYKIVLDDEEFIAFDDAEHKQVYVGSKNKLYNYDSDIYEKVVNLCGD